MCDDFVVVDGREKVIADRRGSYVCIVCLEFDIKLLDTCPFFYKSPHNTVNACLKN